MPNRRFDLLALVLNQRIRYGHCDTQQCLFSVILGCVVVTQQSSDLGQSNPRILPSVGETCK